MHGSARWNCFLHMDSELPSYGNTTAQQYALLCAPPSPGSMNAIGVEHSLCSHIVPRRYIARIVEMRADGGISIVYENDNMHDIQGRQAAPPSLDLQ